MLGNITIGQYFPQNSIIHNLDPRIKIIITVAITIVVFLAKSLVSYVFLTAFIIFIIIMSKISIRIILRNLKPIILIIVLTSLLNMLYTKSTPENIVLSFWVIVISKQGIYLAVFMSLRLVLLITGTSFLTYTTSPIALTDALERLLKPLKFFKLPVHEFSMMMTIALRFIPTLIDETDKIINAQKSRGADFESGNILKRAKAMIPILVPLIVSAFRRAEELALAMESRCYIGGEGRTRMKQLKIHFSDGLAILSMASVFICVFFLNNVGAIRI